MGTPQIPSVDSDSKQFPTAIRQRVADNLKDAASVEGVALNVAVTKQGTPLFFRQRSQRVIVIGDSITQGGDGQGPRPYWGGSIWSYLAVASKHRFHLVRNAGIGGQTTAQMLDRFDTDVTAYNPGIVVISGGTNDRNGGTMTIAQTRANLVAMINKAKAAGITPVLATAPPTDVAGNGAFSTIALNRAGVDSLNAWIRSYARDNSINLFDLHRYWVDSTSAGYKSGYTGDGTHPTTAAILFAVNALLSSDLPTLFQGAATVAYSNADNANGFANAFATTDTNADGIPDFWYFPSFSAITLTDATYGKWVGVVRQGSDTSAYTAAAQNLSVGDVVAVSGRVKQTSGVTSTIALIDSSTFGALATPLGAFSSVDDGVFYMEYTVQSGVTGVMLLAQTGAAAGTVSISQPTLLNLTKLGLV